MSEETRHIHDEFIVTGTPSMPFASFLEEKLDGYRATEKMSLHPTIVVFGNGVIISACVESRQISSSTGYREGKKVTFTYRLPEDERLIVEKLIPLSRRYFGGTHV